MVARLFEMLLPTRPGEQRLTFALLLHNLFAVGAFLTGRTVRDALFLTHGDKDTLAWMYVASAVAVTLTGLLYTPLASRVRRDRVTLVTAALFSGFFVLAWWAEQSRADWVYPAIYVFVEVMGAIVLVQFWTLANELFNAREAKRLYGFIGAGGTLANIFIGLLGARVALYFGTSSLLLLVAFLLVGTAGSSFAASRFGRQRLFARAATGKPNLAARRVGGASRVLGNGHLRTVALLAAVTFFTTTMIDFQFKVIAAREVPSNELAAYFSYFSVVVGDRKSVV